MICQVVGATPSSPFVRRVITNVLETSLKTEVQANENQGGKNDGVQSDVIVLDEKQSHYRHSGDKE
jgi:hypothetical protein